MATRIHTTNFKPPHREDAAPNAGFGEMFFTPNCCSTESTSSALFGFRMRKFTQAHGLQMGVAQSKTRGFGRGSFAQEVTCSVEHARASGSRAATTKLNRTSLCSELHFCSQGEQHGAPAALWDGRGCLQTSNT